MQCAGYAEAAAPKLGNHPKRGDRGPGIAPFPEGVMTPVRYGNRIGAIAVYLVGQQLLPWARACEVLSDLLGIQMSEGTLAKVIECCAYHLSPIEEQLKAALIKAAVLHQDETGHDAQRGTPLVACQQYYPLDPLCGPRQTGTRSPRCYRNFASVQRDECA